MRTKLRLSCQLLLLISALAGCSGTPSSIDESEPGLVGQPGRGGDGVLRLASLEYFGNAIEVGVPQVAKAGQRIEVLATTYAGSCARNDTITMDIAQQQTSIVLYEQVPRDTNTVCTAALGIETRRVQLTFAQAGTATILVTGKREPGGDVVVVRRSVEVR